MFGQGVSAVAPLHVRVAIYYSVVVQAVLLEIVDVLTPVTKGLHRFGRNQLNHANGTWVLLHHSKAGFQLLPFAFEVYL